MTSKKYTHATIELVKKRANEMSLTNEATVSRCRTCDEVTIIATFYAVGVVAGSSRGKSTASLLARSPCKKKADHRVGEPDHRVGEASHCVLIQLIKFYTQRSCVCLSKFDRNETILFVNMDICIFAHQAEYLGLSYCGILHVHELELMMSSQTASMSASCLSSAPRCL